MSTLANPIETADTAVSAMAHPARQRKRPPSHPGEMIADILDEQRVSARAAAVAIGMSHTGLVKVLKGESPVTTETALRIAAYFDNDTPDFWLRLQADYDLFHARAELGAELKKIRPIGR